jgi:hypothetical protein
MQYKFKYRRSLFWKSVIVIGHGYNQPQDKMTLYYPDGSVQEIAFWSKCEVALGTDWVLAQKKNMEQKTGQPISLAVQA